MKTIASPLRFDLFQKFKPYRGERSSKGFSLVELLCVLAVISLLAATVTPALNSMQTAGSVTGASDSISAALQRGRTYAMAHNTYVWVGFYEEAANAPSPTNVFPYSGVGRVVIGMAASVDGTSSSVSTGGLPALTPIEKLIRLPNVHVTAIGAPPTSVPSGDTSLLDSRPSGAYNASGTLLYGISSDSNVEAKYPITVDQYTFYNTVRFSPSGEAVVNDDTSFRRVCEIGLRPTHGSTVDSNSSNIVAVQFTGIGGNVQVYRK